MRPKGNATIYRPDLGVMVMEYVDDIVSQPIGLRVMPLFPTTEKSATYPVIPAEALLETPDTSRAPRGKYNRSDWDYERGKYNTNEQGWEEPVDDEERKMLEGETNPGMADFIGTKRAWGIIMRAQEKRIASSLFNATNFTAHSVTNEWDDAANATPITDVNDGMLSVRTASGLIPNALIIAYSTFINLKNCAQVVDRLKYTFPGIDINKMTSAQLADIFNIENVLIGGAVSNIAGKGLPANISDIWSNEYTMLTRIAAPGSRDIVEPCVGRTFLWTEDSKSNAIVETYREESRRSDVIRVRHNVDETLIQSYDDTGAVDSNIAAACSYLLDNITT